MMLSDRNNTATDTDDHLVLQMLHIPTINDIGLTLMIRWLYLCLFMIQFSQEVKLFFEM